ncbi:uncharacterized protein LOC113216777 [Frankliniella occidentalis]|uniref:Gustatory receptor n=1 Tax=Frankliniella occidentalis TaxID=133901 RepID=A0A6J1TI14_FRAOC|nr:uncharacterized protein LOC113216777 [Frankliniella occidentalis]
MVAFSGRVIRFRDASQDVYIAGKTGKALKSVDTKPKRNGQQKQQDGEDTRTDLLQPFVRTSPLAVVVLGMAFIGLVPVSFNCLYKPLLSVRRSSLVYAVLLYSTFCVSYAFVWKDQLGKVLDPSSNWDSKLFSLEAILALLPCSIGPWVWTCTTNLRKLMWDFAEYEESFLSVTNQHLRDRWASRVRNLRGFIFVLFVIVGLGVTIAMLFSEIQNEYKSDDLAGTLVDMRFYLPAAYSSTVISTLLLMLNTTYSLQLREAATALSEHLNQLRPGDTVGVRRAQKLWVSLRALFNDRPSVYLLDVFFVSHIFIMMLLAVYLSFALLSLRIVMLAASQYFWMLFLGFELFWMSDLAHAAVTAMHGPVVSALDKLSLDAHDEHFHRAVTFFYMSVSSRPAHLSLSGFTSVDRPLFTSIVSLSVTYLVIMVQFRSDKSHPSSPPQ